MELTETKFSSRPIQHFCQGCFCENVLHLQQVAEQGNRCRLYPVQCVYVQNGIQCQIYDVYMERGNCGVHSGFWCSVTTKKGIQCKSPAKFGAFCGIHK